MYGCEAWTTSTTERKLRTLDNKVWRKFFGLILDNHAGEWQRTTDTTLELHDMFQIGMITNFIKY